MVLHKYFGWLTDFVVLVNFVAVLAEAIRSGDGDTAAVGHTTSYEWFFYAYYVMEVGGVAVVEGLPVVASTARLLED